MKKNILIFMLLILLILFLLKKNGGYNDYECEMCKPILPINFDARNPEIVSLSTCSKCKYPNYDHLPENLRKNLRPEGDIYQLREDTGYITSDTEMDEDSDDNVPPLYTQSSFYSQPTTTYVYPNNNRIKINIPKTM